MLLHSSLSKTESRWDILIKDAERIKNEGNQLYKRGEFESAAKSYQSALKILDPVQFENAPRTACLRMAEVSTILLFNIGSCYFSQNQYRKAVLFYSEALAISPNYVKALYKRACVYEAMGVIEPALKDIKAAFALDGSNVQIYAVYTRIATQYNEKAKQDRKSLEGLSKNMFGTQKAPARNNQQSSEHHAQGSFWNWVPLGVLAVCGLIYGGKSLLGR